MAKRRRKTKKGPSFLFLGIFLVLTLILGLASTSKPNTPIQSKAATSGTTITVSGSGGEAIQRAIDSAKDGDTVILPVGKYTRTGGEPYGEGTGGIQSCFINLRGKSITLKGTGSPKGDWNGSVLFGEGHDKGTHAEGDPLFTRVGICSDGGSVTLDSIHVKEFEGGCMLFNGTNVVLKNSVIDGCDHGIGRLDDLRDGRWQCVDQHLPDETVRGP